MSHVDLGYLENCERWQVACYNFPSKVGGKPAWLCLENLPKSNELQCEQCQQQLIFLCQIYASIEDDEINFHRTIYVFICRNSKCCQRNTNTNLKVFRNNLKRKNKYYSYDPPAEHEENREFSVEKWSKLCNLCGCYSEKQCSRCKLANYCSREHQIIDWKEQHKTECDSSGTTDSTRKPSKLLFPEYEIVIEAEELPTKIVDEDEELKKFDKIKQQSTLNDVDVDDLQTHASIDNDKTFTRFRKRTEIDPEQILRYQRNGEPLWIANEPKPNEIPNCEYCGDCRQFEFQIMPQLLSLLNENDLDWGILAVYTCRNNCNAEDCYKREFVFKQDVAVNTS